MNSILTMEERTLLQSLGCKDKAQAIAVLNSIKMDVPVRSELFANAVAVDNIKSRLSDMQHAVGQMKLSEKDMTAYQQSVVSAVRFVIANRCELDSDMKISGGINLNAADMFKDSRDLIRFCNIINQSAKDVLLEMEREIVNILKQRRGRSNDIQIKSDRTVSSRNSVHGKPRRAGTSEKADRQMRKNMAGMGENGVSHRGSDIHNGGSLEYNSHTFMTAYETCL